VVAVVMEDITVVVAVVVGDITASVAVEVEGIEMWYRWWLRTIQKW
jgi:hypothetical protein